MLPGDNLPKGICEDCVQNVDFVFNFRTLLINNERDLATRLPHLSCDDSGSEQDVLEKKFIPSKDEACFLEEVENSVPEEVDEVEDIIPERDKVSAEQTVPTKQIVSKSDMFKNCIIQCKRCNFTCMDYDEWLKHRVTHRVSYSMCDFCGKTVRTCNLKKHLVVHDGDPATCNICGKVFKNVESLRGHAPVHRGYRYNCDLCGSKFKFQHHFAKHRRTHFGMQVADGTRFILFIIFQSRNGRLNARYAVSASSIRRPSKSIRGCIRGNDLIRVTVVIRSCRARML